ncbi:hypothetical protein F2Q68_00009098 [Brassica cretica]|uniref:Uncharacterized protein n=1 Tax=Brassica cretica TaxID=69181 RepID=A0A8S9KT35_BRACR|nr:hypothetical protein F2Q68_00009098 [Brassica cretica]
MRELQTPSHRRQDKTKAQRTITRRSQRPHATTQQHLIMHVQPSKRTVRTSSAPLDEASMRPANRDASEKPHHLPSTTLEETEPQTPPLAPNENQIDRPWILPTFSHDFQYRRSEVNQHPVAEVMPILLKSGQSASREEAVEEMKDCRSTLQHWCRSKVMPKYGLGIFYDRLKPRNNHKLPECPWTT